jgi:translation initiation factor eIF-2B subunit epsilon
LTQLGQLLKKWCIILSKFGRQQVDQVTIIFGIEQSCSFNDSMYLSFFLPTLQILYNNCEILTEDAVEEWEQRNLDTTPENIYLKLAKPFLEWLKEAEEEEEESD